jgi:hypothetical protein
MAGKDNYEYVSIRNHPAVLAGLEESSDAIQQNIGTAFEDSQLCAQKHEEVQRAQASTHELMGELSKLRKMMPVKETGKRAEPRPRIVTQFMPPAPRMISEDFVERSHKALLHLNQNIAELKQELGKIK